MIASERDKETNRVLTAFLVPKQADITGQYLKDARVSFDRQQRPVVEFQFNSEGGQHLQRSDRGERRRQLAIVLDNRVYSAPNIRSRIGARGQIEGRFTAAGGRRPRGGAALGLAADPRRDRGGAHDRPRARRRLDPPRHPGLGREPDRRARVRGRLLPPVGRVRDDRDHGRHDRDRGSDGDVPRAR